MRRGTKGAAVFTTSDLSPDFFCSNGYASSSEVQAPFISPSGRCYYRVSESEADCSAAYAGRSRICLCSSPCLEGYYGTSSQCRRCPRRSTSAAGKSFVTSCICENDSYLVADLTKPYGYVAVCYCDAYTDTHPYIFVSHVHTPNQFRTYTYTDSYILHTFWHAGARDFVSNVQCLCNPLRAAPTYQTANVRQAFISQMVWLSVLRALPEPQAQLVAPVRTPANVKQDTTSRQLNSTSVASSAQTRPIVPRVALVFNSVYATRVSVSPQTATTDVLLHQTTFANQK